MEWIITNVQLTKDLAMTKDNPITVTFTVIEAVDRKMFAVAKFYRSGHDEPFMQFEWLDI